MRPVARFFWNIPTSGPSRYLFPILWMLVIFILSSIPGDRYPRVDIPNADKGMHALLYLPVGWLFARATAGEWWRQRWIGLVIAVVAGCVFGATDEIHQIWTPHRECSMADWVVDCAAVGVGALLWWASEVTILRAKSA
ncbi:MAG: VanZ family protein [Candidatus Sumerlaeaceae bacterium]|nr:VanZ family protein [Candidatus Sumerlaeaceae bacterium]